MMNVPVVREHPERFKTGLRVLMLRSRKKDGEENNNNQHNARCFITASPEEFDKRLGELLLLRKGGERVYSTVDERDLSKAVRLFKERQLDVDYDPHINQERFYVDIHSRFVGCLAAPQARKGALFLIDVDADDEHSDAAVLEWLNEHDIEVVHDYPTKNGTHIITQPFNHAGCPFASKISKNGMMLWAWGITPRGTEGRVLPSQA